MAIASTTSLVDSLRQYRLLEPVQLEEITRNVQAHCPEPKGLAGELIQRKWLTPYQANQLLQGRGQELLLGSYVLLEKLGEGGMGQVFKARNWKLGRVVALKLIRKERLESPDAIRRFQREIHAAAALDHPNIVRAYDADQIGGTHLLVMECIEGATDLANLVKKQGPLPVERACEYIRQAALGLQHAFERGMVHRDIKPANLLLTADEKTVKILDMGLARLDQESSDGEESGPMTQEGAVMGTPDYIAPEQAMESHTVDIRADLYSLGCTFYYLLTAKVPFPGGTLMKKLLKHRLEEPKPVERLRLDTPPGVARVVRKLMAKKPEDRYQTPADVVKALASAISPGGGLAGEDDPTLAEGLRAPAADPSGDTFVSPFASLDREPAEAGNSPERLRQKASEVRWLVFLAAGGSFLLVGLVVLLSLLWRDLAGTKPPAAKALSSSEAQGDDTRRQPNSLTEQEKAAGWILLFDGKSTTSWRGYKRQTMPERWQIQDGALVLSRTTGKNGDDLVTVDEDDDFELAFDWKISPGGNSGVFYRVVEGAADPWATGLEYHVLDNSTADGRQPETAAASCYGLFPVTTDRTKPVGEWNRGRIIVSCNVVEHWLNGERVVTYAIGSPTWQQRIKPANRGKLPRGRIALRDQGHEVAYRNLKIRPLERGGAVERFRWPVKELGNSEANLWAMNFSPDNRLLVPTGDAGPRGVIRVWDVAAKPRWELPSLDTGREVWFFGACFLPDGKQILTHYSADNNLYLWETATGRLLRQLQGHTKPVTSAAVSPDGRFAVSGSEDHSLRLWDLSNAKHIRRFVGFLGKCSAVFSPNGKQVLGSADDPALHLWDAATGREVHRLTVASGPCRGLFSRDGRLILSFGAKDAIRLWDVASGKQRSVLDGGEVGRSAAFLPSGLEIATWGQDRVLRVSEVAAGRVRTLDLGEDWIVAEGLGFSPDGRRFLTSHVDGSVRLRDLATGAELLRFPGVVNARAMTFSPDGSMAACGSFRTGVYVLTLPTPPAP